MNFLINASNIHIGGGKSLLDDFISSARKHPDISFTIFIDSRYKYQNSTKNIHFVRINKFKRFLCDFKIKKNQLLFDKIFYFGNIPPFFKFKTKTILLLSSRFFLENKSLNEFKFLVKLQILIEKLIFNFFIKNIDHLIVQSESMLQLAKNNKKIKSQISILAFKNFENSFSENKKIHSDPNKNTFLYIASEQKYKNHLNLIYAWNYISKFNLAPPLHITMNKNHPNFKFIYDFINKNNLNVINHSMIDRQKLLDLYSLSNILIYPSKFESYGLPLIEARDFGLNIIASELDFVRDIVDPIDTFNPNSYVSIGKSILRVLNIEYPKTDIISAYDFINIIKSDEK